MIHYPLLLTPDDNGTLLVTCPDLPEVTSDALNERHAQARGAGAIAEAIAGRLADGRDVPRPGEGPGSGPRSWPGAEPDGEPAPDALPSPSAPLDQGTATALLLHWLERDERRSVRP